MMKFGDEFVDLGAPPALPPTSRAGQIEAVRRIWEWAGARLARTEDKQDKRLVGQQYQLPQELIDAKFDDNPDDYFVLRGPAGTGKTFIMAEVVLALSAAGLKIAVGAPTNKAVGVIETKVQQAAKQRINAATFKSVHSHVGLRMIETDEGEVQVSQGDFSDLNTYDIFIVDEGSMLDAQHQLRGIAGNRGQCIVLIVADFCQIPPVNSSGVSPAYHLPQWYELTEVVRQAEGNPIIQAAWNIRACMNMDDPERGDMPIHASDLEEWLPGCMVRGVQKLNQQIFERQRAGQDARGIAYRNAAVGNMNDYVHYEMYPDCGSNKFCVGERVVVQSACRAVNAETGRNEDLVTSEELMIMDVYQDNHPIYERMGVYTMVVQDVRGVDYVVHVPRLMSAFNHAVNEKFNDVRDIKRQMGQRYDRSLQERYQAALREAWGFKKAFADIRLAYASTAHKIQGSTIFASLVNYPDIMQMRSDFERNRALYVALTRPSDEIMIAY